VPEPLLNECLREEAGISTDGTKFPLVELLLGKQLLPPSEIAAVLGELGIDTLLCPICEGRHELARCIGPQGAQLSCESCGVPMQFIGDLTESQPSPPPENQDWQVEATLRIEPRAEGGATAAGALEQTRHAAGDRRESLAETLRGPAPTGRPAEQDSVDSIPVSPLGMTAGQVLDDRYEIIEQLQDQQGIVYKALERGLDRLVAVKILDRSKPQNDRLAREIDSVGKLSHPNIITILNVGSIAELEYFVLEYVEGTELNEMLRAGALDFQEATRIARDLSDALYHAHTRGLIHGGLSPSSIRIDKAGHPYLIDFCLASKSTAPNPGAYRAPELGSARVADESSDIYSLGAIYYHMVSGKAPNGTSDQAQLRSELPFESSAICVKALDHDPSKRHDSMQELRKAFDLFLESSKLASRRIIRQRKSRRSLALAILLVVALVGAGGAYLKWGRGGSGQAAQAGAVPQSKNNEPQVDPHAAIFKSVLAAYAAANWDKAHSLLEELKEKKVKLLPKLAAMERELTLYRKAKELENNPEALCRYLVTHAREFAKKRPFLQLVERNKLWQLVLHVRGAGSQAAAQVTLYPIDSLTQEVSREKPLELGSTPLDCPFINQQGYQIVVVRGSERLKFPIEFRLPISAPNNAPRRKEIRLKLDIPSDMCLVPAISGAAFAQETGADRDFLMDRLEVTSEQFEAFLRQMRAKQLAVKPPRVWPNGRMPVGWEQLPVTGVTFMQATYFALWSGKRLPTKIEWNKAAGGQDQREYPWGSSFKDPAAISQEDGFRKPQRVGGREAGESPYGIQDLSGNVWEIVVPTTLVNRGKTLVRGGSFREKADKVTINSQNVLSRDVPYVNVGFRCAKSLLTSRSGQDLTVEQALADSYPGVALEGLLALSKQGTRAARQQIFKKLASPSETVRTAAAFHLLQNALGDLRSLFEKALADPDPINRLRAVRALSLGLRPTLVGLLTRVSGDTSDQVREEVYRALVKFRVVGLQSLLLKGLKDRLVVIRQRSVLGLRPYSAPVVTQALRERLGDKSAEVRMAAAESLLQRRDTGSAALIVAMTLRMTDNRRRGRMYSGLPVLGPEAVVAASAKELGNPKASIRGAAVELISYVGAAQYTDWIIERLNDQNIGRHCLRALQRLATPSACQALVPLLKSKKTKPQTLNRVCAMMGRVRYEPAVPAMIALAGRQNLPASLRRSLLTYIGQIGGKLAQDFLFEARTTKNHPLRRFALQGLAASQHPRVRGVLMDLRKQIAKRQKSSLPVIDYFRATAGDKTVWRSLLSYLQRVDMSRFKNGRLFAGALRYVMDDKQLTALFKSASVKDRQLASVVLAAGEQRRVDPKLLARLMTKDPSPGVRLSVLQAISSRGFGELLPQVEALLKTKRPGTRGYVETQQQLTILLRMTYRNGMRAQEKARQPSKKTPPKKTPPKKTPPKKGEKKKPGN